LGAAKASNPGSGRAARFPLSVTALRAFADWPCQPGDILKYVDGD
jgi:hypothetical protein